MSFKVINIYEEKDESGVDRVVFQIYCSGGYVPNTNKFEISEQDAFNKTVRFNSAYKISQGQGASTTTFYSTVASGNKLVDWDLLYPGDPDKETVGILTSDGGGGRSDRSRLKQAFALLQRIARYGWGVKPPKHMPIFERRD